MRFLYETLGLLSFFVVIYLAFIFLAATNDQMWSTYVQ
jgi:hypothetical protein